MYQCSVISSTAVLWQINHQIRLTWNSSNCFVSQIPKGHLDHMTFIQNHFVHKVFARCVQVTPLLWPQGEGDGVSNHRRLDCLISRLFRRRSKKTSKLSVTGLCQGNPPETSVSPPPTTHTHTHKRPVTRKMFPFDDVIMVTCHPRMNMTDSQSVTKEREWRAPVSLYA